VASTGSRLRSLSVERGLLGGDHRWIGVGAAVWGVTALRWALRNTNEPITITEPLRPGETIVITHQVPPPKVSRRRRRRQAKRDRRDAKRRAEEAERQAEEARRQAKRDRRAARRRRATSS
jgi:hypothetical protein